MSNDHGDTLLETPGTLFYIPQNFARKVEEVEEEIFLLYTLRNTKDEDLGIFEQRKDIVHLFFHFAPPAKSSKNSKSYEHSVNVFQNVRV